MQERKFVEGLRFFPPFENKPPEVKEWLKGVLLVETDKLIAFLKENSIDGKMKIDMKKSKKGDTIYLEQNTFQPRKQDNTEQDNTEQDNTEQDNTEDINTQDIF